MRHLRFKNIVYAVFFFVFSLGIYGVGRLTIVDFPILGFTIAFIGLIIIVLIAKKVR